MPDPQPDQGDGGKPPFGDDDKIRGLADREVLGVAFRGEQAEHSISLPLASTSLTALAGLMDVLAAARRGPVGNRGVLQRASGLETVDMVDAAFGSAAFYFAPRPPDDMTLDVEPVPSTRVAQLAGDMLDLIEAAKASDVVAALEGRQSRVVSRYVDLLGAIAAADVATAWMAPGRQARLSHGETVAALEVLEDVDVISEETQTFTGTLYEANARSGGFRLERQDDGSIIVGRFDEQLIDELGTHWNEMVVASTQVITERLRRTGQLRRRFTLTGLTSPPAA